MSDTWIAELEAMLDAAQTARDDLLRENQALRDQIKRLVAERNAALADAARVGIRGEVTQ